MPDDVVSDSKERRVHSATWLSTTLIPIARGRCWRALILCTIQRLQISSNSGAESRLGSNPKTGVVQKRSAADTVWARAVCMMPVGAVSRRFDADDDVSATASVLSLMVETNSGSK